MTRSYTLPDRFPGEDNQAWCRRAAASIPPEAIVRELVAYLDRRANQKLHPTCSVIGDILGHGSGVSAAVAELYREREEVSTP